MLDEHNEKYSACPSEGSNLQRVNREFLKEDDVETKAGIGGMRDGPCVQVLQGESDCAGFLPWYFVDCKDLIAAS